MIRFDKITAKGFGSIIDKTTFNLNRDSLTIFKGPVGSGKTTIPSILTWCLYGISLKKKGSSIQTWEELRPDDFRGTMARVEFTKDGDEYIVIRCIKYKDRVLPKVKGGDRLILVINGKITEDRNKTDVQKKIVEVLGYSYNLFTNSIVFGQRLKKIIEQSGPDKKKIFDEAFETLFIDKARDNEIKNNQKTKDALSKRKDKLDNLTDKLDDTLELYNDALEFEQNFEKNNKDNKKNLQNRVAKLKLRKSELLKKQKSIKIVKVDRLEKEISKWYVLKNNYTSLSRNIDKLKTKLNNLKKELSEENNVKKLLKVEKDRCYTCGSLLNKDSISKLIKVNNNNISNLKNSISDIRDNISKERVKLKEYDIELIKDNITRLRNDLSSLNSNKALYNEITHTIKTNNSDLRVVNKELESIANLKLTIKSSGLLDKVDDIRSKIKKINREIKKLSSEAEISNWLIKDPLSNNGLKTYIFDSLLEKVNDRLNSYSNIVGFRIEFGIDLESVNKDFYQVIWFDNILVNYEDLSGGQKQLTDTVVAISIHDIINQLKPINLLFMDEPFEGLGINEIDILAELLTHKSKEQNLFLITHHESFNPSNSNTIYFKRNELGQTEIEG